MKFKHLEITVRNQTYIHKESNNRLNLRDACYHSPWNLLYSCVYLLFYKCVKCGSSLYEKSIA
jgi:hypothetical protein